MKWRLKALFQTFLSHLTLINFSFLFYIFFSFLERSKMLSIERQTLMVLNKLIK